jgi:hypothetical protein
MRRDHVPYLVLLAGVVFTTSLQGMIRDEVFPTGDNALKALMTRQFSLGDLSFDLRLPAESWVEELWAEGFYPFEPPHVYEREGRRVIRFPLPFLLLNAPFYWLWGYRGLYVIPLLSTWLLWWLVLRAGRRVGLDPWSMAVSLAFLVFGSPVSLYSAIYWDHTLAVTLAFAGIATVLFRPPGGLPRPAVALVAGALVGASAWFREEHLLLGGLFVVGGMLARRYRWRLFGALEVLVGWFAAGFGLGVLVFAAWNVWLYQHPLGLHAVYSLETFSWTGWERMWGALRQETERLISHFPVLFVTGLTFVPGLGTQTLQRLGPPLVLLCGTYCVCVPLLLQTAGGKEWGPRFLLIVMPLLSLVLALILQALALRRRWLWSVAPILAALFAWSAQINCLREVRSLGRAYSRRVHTLDFVRSDDTRFVAVSHQYVSQLLVGRTGPKTYFLAHRGKHLRTLAKALRREGEQRFLYICDPQYGCGPLGSDVPQLSFYDGRRRRFAHFSRVGAFERYIVYDVALGS